MNPIDIQKFNAIAQQFVELDARLFYYSPGFEELMVLIGQDRKYFLIRFIHTASIKTDVEWKFARLTVELCNEEKTSSRHPYYKIFDRIQFEATCQLFVIREVTNGRETLEYSELLNDSKLLDRCSTVKTQRKLIHKFPYLRNCTAHLFQYYR